MQAAGLFHFFGGGFLGLTVPDVWQTHVHSGLLISHCTVGEFPLNFCIFTVPGRAAPGEEVMGGARGKAAHVIITVGIKPCPEVFCRSVQ